MSFTQEQIERGNLLTILNTIKEDFKMLQDGRWSLECSDGTEIEASLMMVGKAIEIVKNLNK
jgi:hypothetical protein